MYSTRRTGTMVTAVTTTAPRGRRPVELPPAYRHPKDAAGARSAAHALGQDRHDNGNVTVSAAGNDAKKTKKVRRSERATATTMLLIRRDHDCETGLPHPFPRVSPSASYCTPPTRKERIERSRRVQTTRVVHRLRARTRGGKTEHPP